MQVTTEGVFITQHNHNRIIPTNIPDNIYKDKSGLLKYEELRKIFNDKELDQFASLWTVLENPEYLIQRYVGAAVKDKPDIYSSYHRSCDCQELRKNHVNYTIGSNDPVVRNKISVKARIAFDSYAYNQELTDCLRFKFRQGKVFRLTEKNDERYQCDIPANIQQFYNDVVNEFGEDSIGHLFDVIPNSGMWQYQNMSLVDIESKIDQLIQGSIAYRNQDEFMQRKIQNFTFAPISAMKRNKGEKEQTWLVQFKLPLSELVNNYYWIKFNPKLTVEKTVLDSLGFKPCKRCFK